VATGGFVGCGHPEWLSLELERRFLREGHPRDLSVVYAAGQGDGKTRGLNHLAHKGLVRRVIGGHWNLAPAMGRLAVDNLIEAYNFPQGAICHLFRSIAAGVPGYICDVGLGTFVDPRLGGGRLNARTTEDLVELVSFDGREWMRYKPFRIDVALLRGTSCDSFGNIGFEREAVIGDALSIAQAAKAGKGKVIVQVERQVDDYSRDPKSIHIPGILVDAVVLAPPEYHQQTFAEDFNPQYVETGSIEAANLQAAANGPKLFIARRALQSLRAGDVVNLGIGLPEAVAQVARQQGRLDEFTLTLESGPVGGIPAGGLSFGASALPMAIIDQPSMFDFYNGGGLDVAVLSMAECDRHGNVNVSRFGGRLAGAGGFIDISQSTKRLVFVGTFTAGGLDVVFKDGQLSIVKEGAVHKLVDEVEQVTFNGARACAMGQQVLYITERCVFELVQGGLELIEIAPGVDVKEHVLAQMGFNPIIRESPRVMPPDLFRVPRKIPQGVQYSTRIHRRGLGDPRKAGGDAGDLNTAPSMNSGRRELSATGRRNPVMGFENLVEEIQVLGRDLVDKVRDLIHEGNVQRIVVKDEHGNTFVEIPVTVAAIGAVIAPLLAAIGAISALVAKFTVVVVRSEPKPPEGGQSAP
jgi:propionate CoA-transferase